MANVHRISDFSNNNNRNFQAGGGQNPPYDPENEPGYVNIPFLSILHFLLFF